MLSGLDDSSGMQITEALKLQMEVQKRLHKQLEVFMSTLKVVVFKLILKPLQNQSPTYLPTSERKTHFLIVTLAKLSLATGHVKDVIGRGTTKLLKIDLGKGRLFSTMGIPFVRCPSLAVKIPGGTKRTSCITLLKTGELNDSSRSSQIKSIHARGIKGLMQPVIRINACVVKDLGSFVSESRVKVKGKERKDIFYAKVVCDHVSGYSKGFGFVQYATIQEAESGIHEATTLDCTRKNYLQTSDISDGVYEDRI